MQEIAAIQMIGFMDFRSRVAQAGDTGREQRAVALGMPGLADADGYDTQASGREIRVMLLQLSKQFAAEHSAIMPQKDQ